ncbi:MAG: DUF4154 domain-containing protein [Henriciella sp.]|nr:DUF4154 domain-containing protein [Henriciella sp.]
MKTSLCAACLGLSFLIGLHAQPQEKDIEVAARTFKFVEGAPSGEALLGIVSDPAIAASSSQANALAAALEGGKTISGVTFVPKVIAPSEISGVDVVFVTNGMGAHHEAIGAAVSSGQLLSFSTDKTCVTAKHCFMAVQSAPKVEITISRSATEAAGLQLNQALKMMVDERD